MQILMLQHMQSTMRRARPLLSLMLVLSSASNALATNTLSTEWHVSTRGNDSWSGLLAKPTPDGRDGPFRTFERGCIAIRPVSQDAAGRTPRQVIVHAGTYRLPGGLTIDDSVSGTNGAPTIFRSAGDGEVVLTSGAVLLSRALSKVTNKATLDRLPPQARSEVVQLDGSTLGFAAWPNRITSLPPGSELPCDHRVTNCHIWQFSELKMTFAHGIHAEGVGIYIANNLIEDAPHQAVYVQGNDNVFERNFVRNVCIETDDCGAYYSGRNPSCQGNVIRGNLFMDIGRIDKHGCASVYFGDGQGGDTLNGNVFVRGSRGTFGAIFMNGGRDVQARSNVFLDCTVALAAVSWSEGQWEQSVAGEGEQSWLGWPALLTQEVDIRSPTYIKRYPSLIGFFVEMRPLTTNP
jgi:hypothetical protein